MELEILYRLSMLVGFLLAGFLALFIAGAMALLCCLSKRAFRKLDKAMKELEEVCRDVDES